MTWQAWQDWLLDVTERPDIYGNTAQRWLTAVMVALAVAIALWLVKSLLTRRFAALAKRMPDRWPVAVLGVVQRTRSWFLLGMALYCGSLGLIFPKNIEAVVQSAAVVVLVLQAAIWGNSLLNFAVGYYSRQRLTTDAESATSISVLGFLAKVVLWSVVVLVALDNLGVNVTALVAGLGIGGIAVALAAQNILGDLFASLSIMLDKPFILGDFIAVGEFMGTVEHIGVKTTRLKSLSGEQLVFANNDLLKSRIRNYKRMSERRVVFSLGATYETPPAQLAALPGALRQIVESQSPVRFDRAHFKTFGDSALVFEVVYYVLTADFNQYMDIQQAINLAILERFSQDQIEFAYPTQTVYVQGQSEAPVLQPK